MGEKPDFVKQNAAPCRLFGILARKAKVGVLFRRGPSKWVRLIKWNVADDSFEPGQWFHGRIYERRCDLSPDGRLLVYFASKHTHRLIHSEPSLQETEEPPAPDNRERVETRESLAWSHRESWTAVSKPPWLTALALWPKGDCWAGGGLFVDDRTLWLNHRPAEAKPHFQHRPKGLIVRPREQACGEDDPIYADRLERDGWTLEQEAGWPLPGPGEVWQGHRTNPEEIYCRRSPCGQYDLRMILEEIRFHGEGGPYVLRFEVREVASGKIHELGRGTWADWDHRGRLVMAQKGKLLHCAVSAHGGFGPRLIHNFNGGEPEAIPSPASARRWD